MSGQFNISALERWDLAEKGQRLPEVLGKIKGDTLNRSSIWLVLQADEEVGYIWTEPVLPREGYKQEMLRRGMRVDCLADIPTIIF